MARAAGVCGLALLLAALGTAQAQPPEPAGAAAAVEAGAGAAGKKGAAAAGGADGDGGGDDDDAGGGAALKLAIRFRSPVNSSCYPADLAYHMELTGPVLTNTGAATPTECHIDCCDRPTCGAFTFMPTMPDGSQRPGCVLRTAAGERKRSTLTGAVSGRVVRPDASALFHGPGAVQQSPLCDGAVVAAMHDLYTRAKAAKKAIAQLTIDIDAAQARYLDIAADMSAKQSEVAMRFKGLESLELRRRAALDARAKLLAKQHTMTAQAKQGLELVDRLTTQVADMTARRDGDRGRLARMNNALAVLKDALDKAASEAAALKAEKATLEPQVKAAADAVAGLAAAVTKAATEVKLSQQALLSARLAVVTATEGEGSVKADREATEHALETALEAIGAEGVTQATLAGVLEMTTRQTTDVEGKLAAAKATHEALAADLAQLSANLTGVSADLAKAQTALAAKRAAAGDLQHKVDDITRGVVAYTGRYKAVLADLEHIANETTGTTLAATAMGKAIADAAAALAVKEGEVAARLAAVDALQRNVSEARGALSAAEMKRAGVAHTVNAVVGETARVNRVTAQLQVEAASLVDAIGKLTARAEAARKKKFVAVRRIQTHRAAAEDLAARRAYLERRGDCEVGPGAPPCDLGQLKDDYAGLLDAVVNGRADALLQRMQDEAYGVPSASPAPSKKPAAAAAGASHGKTPSPVPAGGKHPAPPPAAAGAAPSRSFFM